MPNFWFINIKEGLRHGGIDLKFAYVPKQATNKNMEMKEKTLISRCFAFEE